MVARETITAQASLTRVERASRTVAAIDGERVWIWWSRAVVCEGERDAVIAALWRACNAVTRSSQAALGDCRINVKFGDSGGDSWVASGDGGLAIL